MLQAYNRQEHVYDRATICRVRINFPGLKIETNPENQGLYGKNLEISISGFLTLEISSDCIEIFLSNLSQSVHALVQNKFGIKS